MKRLIRKLLIEGLNNIKYDELFIKLAWLKYYNEGTPEEIRNIPKLEASLKSTPKPKPPSTPEDSRTEWGGVKLGDVVSAEELPKIYDRMGFHADNSSNKFDGNYTLRYVPVINTIDKYEISDAYEDLEHFDRVNEYSSVIKNGQELPPVIFSGFFHDGQHRMAAHVDLGRKRILAFDKI